MSKCQASQLIDFLVSRGLIKSSWSDMLSELEVRKSEILNHAPIFDEQAKIYYQSHHQEDMMMTYYSCKHLLQLLMSGKDGEDRWFRFFGFKSGIINGMKLIVSNYETSNLFLAEMAIGIRRILFDIRDSQKSIAETKSRIVENSDNISLFKEKIMNIQTRLSSVLSKYGLDMMMSTPTNLDSSEIQRIVEEKLEMQKIKLQSSIDNLINSDQFNSIIQQYHPDPKQSDQLLLVEELLAYSQTLNDNNVILLTTIRDGLNHIEKSNGGEKEILEIINLNKQLINLKINLNKLYLVENKLVSLINDGEIRLNELKVGLQDKVREIQSELNKMGFSCIEIVY